LIESLKDLEKLLKLCRRQGVTKINFDNVSLELGELPIEKDRIDQTDEDDSPYGNFPQGELTPEQLMFYSAGGDPSNDPILRSQAV
jgi:hypothetical protein